MMARVKFKLKVLTPLFMGGADPHGEPELRAASIRGAMRFWFRAIAGAVTSDPGEVYKLESEVFGDTEKKSKVVVRVKVISERRIYKGSKVPFIPVVNPDKYNVDNKLENPLFFSNIEDADKLNFLAYLANMGLAEYEKRTRGFAWTRPGFNPGTLFKVEIISSQQEIQDIASLTFQIAVQLGGFGARWRHGFGSCAIQSPQKSWNVALKEVKEKLRSFVEKLGIDIKANPNERPLFASFKDKYFEIFERRLPIETRKTKSHNWEEVLTFIGLKYREFRIKEGDYKRFGHTKDYFTLIQADGLSEGDLLNDIFGLPIQFGKGKEVNVADRRRTEIGRRASPLILHVEPKSKTIRATIFKSQPLPDYPTTKYQAKFNGTIELLPLTFEDFDRVIEFVNFVVKRED